MTQDEIIKLARQAGGIAYVNRHYPGETAFAFSPKAFEAFAELVANKATDEANARANASWTLMCKKMVEAEREECAKVCETNHGTIRRNLDSYQCAAAIRARGQQ